MAGSTTRTAVTDRPWHLIPQDIRERSAIANCEVDGDEGHTCGGPFDDPPIPTPCDCAIRSEAFRAAAQLLREAAPYPDEALVFEVICDALHQGEHVELVDFDDDCAIARVTDHGDNTITTWLGWYKLRPLTIAAHDALETLGGGR